MLLVFVITIAFGALWGLWHGFLITCLGIAPFVATLVTYIVAAGADEAIAPNPIAINNSTFLPLAGSTWGKMSIATIVFVLITVLAWLLLERTYIGRETYALGGNREASRLAGIPVNRRIVMTYVVSSACAGVVGMILASHLTSGTADSLSGTQQG